MSREFSPICNAKGEICPFKQIVVDEVRQTDAREAYERAELIAHPENWTGLHEIATIGRNILFCAESICPGDTCLVKEITERSMTYKNLHSSRP